MSGDPYFLIVVFASVTQAFLSGYSARAMASTYRKPVLSLLLESG